jgi:putative heme-binding domain-containing protein
LLTKVFDPNQSLRAGFQAATVYTVQGRALTGVLIEDNSSRVVLKLQGGKVEKVPRDDVDSVMLSKVSLMPEGIEKQLSEQELADLFAFLSLDRSPEDAQARKIPGAPP